MGTSRHWFYRSWFHSYTIAWDHPEDDQHPYTRWHDFHYGSLPIWEACDRWEHAVYEQEQRLMAQQQRAPLDSHPRGVKRQAIENLENERLDLLVQNLVQRFTDLEVSGNPELRSLTPDLQRQLVDGLIHNLSRYQQDLSAAAVAWPSFRLHVGDPLRLQAPPRLLARTHLLILLYQPRTFQYRAQDSGSMLLTSSSISSTPYVSPPYPNTAEDHA